MLIWSFFEAKKNINKKKLDRYKKKTYIFIMRQDKNKKEKIMKSKSIGILESKDFSGVIIAVNTIKVVELPDYPEGSNGEMMRGIVVCDGPDGDYIEKTSSRRNNYLATTDDAIDECRKIWDNDRRYNFIVTRNS